MIDIERNHAEIPYINNEHAEAATNDVTLKLVFRLLDFTILSEGQCLGACFRSVSAEGCL